MTPRTLELLAPAKNLESGKAAIDHGADAVYIGASRFGARAAAGNSVDDIRRLCEYAHIYLAKVYVTVNTILYDSELDATRELICQLHDAGVDAILVQDMALLNMALPNITLHASTQTDNRTKEKVAWLAGQGFKRVVLARELSVNEIKEIHDALPDVELETFVHGALCVSYSGLCYASQYCFNRSANRGECAQFCRMKFNLEDADGTVIEGNRHLLSLKDMCQIDNLEKLAEAGAMSFKIEGRLKDISYVKNVTAAYSQELDRIIAKQPEKYRRASLGRCRYAFSPNLNKTFNRGFTHYFSDGRRADIVSFDTPKAIGENVGFVKEIRGNSFNVAGTASFANGDGLCFVNAQRELEGFRVNRAEGNRIFPLSMPKNLCRGMRLYRNNDQAFEKLLSGNSSQRKIDVNMELSFVAEELQLTLSVCEGIEATASVSLEKQEAVKPQRENIERQLSKLGNTPFECGVIKIIPEPFNYFIPSSVLSELRRKAVEELVDVLRNYMPEEGECRENYDVKAENVYPQRYTYLYNVSNKEARRFYAEKNIIGVSEAFEVRLPEDKMLMQCRYCLRYTLGYCVKHGGKTPEWKEPLRLVLSDGRRFRLQFDCAKCQMNIHAE